ncbi:MAG: DMT family transporter [Pseudomonadota bacterium]|nr:DMT family transporter [Pseudomonadota bacterium]
MNIPASEVRGRRAAYAALVLLTFLWGANWLVMKLALVNANPVTFNVHRTWVAVAVMFAALVAHRRSLWPVDWTAVLVTGFFQTTVNFAGTTMALASGGAGRTSVLVFTMPFWTLLFAWPVLHERVRGTQWLAVALALLGLVLVVEPWDWRGGLAPKLWAVLSGFGWAAGTVAAKYFQRRRALDPLHFIAWQMLAGVLPLTLLAAVLPLPETRWSLQQVMLLLYVGVVSTAIGFLLWLAVLRRLPAGTASLNMFAIPVIALVGSTALFDEALSRSEWIGIGAIAAGLVILTWRALRMRADEPLTPPLPLEGG